MSGNLDRDYDQSAEEHDSEEQRKREQTASPAGFTGGTQEKKRPGTEDAQKRSDTGTGL